uniref:Putative secreted protein n=1 Tax=Ixodes ricinus TaxID=34613 RepID=A0A6B0UEK8_IXORI
MRPTSSTVSCTTLVCGSISTSLTRSLARSTWLLGNRFLRPLLRYFWRPLKRQLQTFSTRSKGCWMTGSTRGTSRTTPTSTSGLGKNEPPERVSWCWTLQ